MKKQIDMVLEDFKNLNLNTIVNVPIIAVYDSPVDYPGQYVARLWDIRNKPTQFIIVKDNIEEIRMAIPNHMTRLGPNSMDDPDIIETWI